MIGPFYHAALTIKFDPSIPRLTIEGREVPIEKVDGLFVSSELPGVKTEALFQLVREIIEQSPEFRKREAIKQEHIAILTKGVKHWNEWRRENPEIRPLLYGIDLSRETLGIDLSSVNFSDANLIASDLSGTELVGANFHEASLGHANLSRANLAGANFCRTDLYRTNLSNANLSHANLQGTQLAKTNFEGAELVNCRIYGMSAWDLNLHGANQKDLIIVYEKSNEFFNGEREESRIIVDDLQVAQFIYLLLRNENIRSVIDTVARRAVLILGRFTSERKAVLDALRDELRTYRYIPMLFDFEKPSSRNFTETVRTLAHLSRFIIADLTDPSSIPQELQAIVPTLAVPIQPVLLEGKEEYAMFIDLRRTYHWVLPTFSYREPEELLASLQERVIEPAEYKAQELERR